MAEIWEHLSHDQRTRLIAFDRALHVCTEHHSSDKGGISLTVTPLLSDVFARAEEIHAWMEGRWPCSPG